MPNGLSVCFRPIEVVLSRRRLPYITISRLFCHTQPPFLNKAVRFMGKVEQPGNEEVIALMAKNERQPIDILS